LAGEAPDFAPWVICRLRPWPEQSKSFGTKQSLKQVAPIAAPLPRFLGQAQRLSPVQKSDAPLFAAGAGFAVAIKVEPGAGFRSRAFSIFRKVRRWILTAMAPPQAFA
jgi:hypothetical protein